MCENAFYETCEGSLKGRRTNPLKEKKMSLSLGSRQRMRFSKELGQ